MPTPKWSQMLVHSLREAQVLTAEHHTCFTGLMHAVRNVFFYFCRLMGLSKQLLAALMGKYWQ